jgi:hypothetical protein
VIALSTPWSIGILLFLIAFWILIFALMKTASRSDQMSQRWLEAKWLEEQRAEEERIARLLSPEGWHELYDQDERP